MIREKRIEEFSLGVLFARASGSPALPTEEEARNVVRLVRAMYEELDQPSQRQDDGDTGPQPAFSLEHIFGQTSGEGGP